MTPRRRSSRAAPSSADDTSLGGEVMGVAAPGHHAAPGQFQQRCHLVAPGGASKLRGVKKGATPAEFKVETEPDSGLMNLRRNNGFRASNSLPSSSWSATSSLIAGFTARPSIAASAHSDGLELRLVAAQLLGPVNARICSNPSGRARTPGFEPCRRGRAIAVGVGASTAWEPGTWRPTISPSDGPYDAAPEQRPRKLMSLRVA